MSASNIPYSEWEKHRAVIHSLYVDEDLPLDALVKRMETVYGFIATKSQYTRQLTSWKIKKNATSIDWKKAAVIIDKRKRQGKESEMYIDGKLIPSKKMKKETARHWPSYLEYIEMKDLPGDFVVQTPPATALHPIQPHRWKMQLDGLPWMKFRDAFMSHSMLFAGPGFDNAPLDLLTNFLVRTPTFTTCATPSRTVQHCDRILPPKPSNRAPTTENSLGDGSSTHFILYFIYLASNNLLERKLLEDTLQWIDNTKNTQVINALLQLKGPTIESCASTLFSGAVRKRLASIVELFLLNRYDPNTRTHHHYRSLGFTGLEIAITMKDNVIIKLLLKHGADPNKCADRSLHPALKSGLCIASHGSLLARYIDSNCDEDVIQLFLDAGANIDGESTGSVITGDDEEYYYGFTHDDEEDEDFSDDDYLCDEEDAIEIDDGPEDVPLVKAVYRANTQVARFLLGAGANANQVDRKVGSAIQTAVKNGDMDMVELLVEAGADVNINNERYSRAWIFLGPGRIPRKLFSPLQLAARAENFEMIQYLLRQGADTNDLPALGIIERPPYATYLRSGEYETPLNYAVLGGNLHMAVLLLNSGANPDAVSFQGHTALGTACRNDNLDMVKLLLAYGATPHVCPELGSSPLQLAIIHKDLRLAGNLLQRGADINAPPYLKGGRTALQAAAETGNASLFKRLLDLGANINAPAAAEKGVTCLQAAMLSDNDEIIRTILNNGGAAMVNSILCAVKIHSFKMVDLLMGLGMDVNSTGIADLGPGLGCRLVTPLVLAIYNKDFDMVDKLLRSGANVSHIYCESEAILPLHQAIRARDLRITKILLLFGANPNQFEPLSGQTSLGLATSLHLNESLTHIVRELINHNANVNLMAKGIYPIENVMMSDELMKMFIEAGADIHAKEGSLLAKAICGGSSSATRLLLDNDVNVNGQDKQCGTPLKAAVRAGNFDLVSELFARGADVNAGLNNLLAYAIDLRRPGIVELLLEKGANTNGISPSGLFWCFHGRKRSDPYWTYVGDRTALVAAAEQNKFYLVKALIERGADVEADNAPRRSTPIQAASVNDNLPMVQMLLGNGADVNAKPRGPIDDGSLFLGGWKFGRRTALQAASENRNLQLAQLLIEHGAKVNMEPYEDGGATALQMAAINGDIQMAVLLLEHGADINGPGASHNGRTALEGAAEHGRLDMIYFLLQNDQDETDHEVRREKAAKYAEREGHSFIAKILREWTQ
ncbi:unnamed protein product [Clonostachys chloroleuca]|uniref:Clr5 domain-containing protein n=1 Tax=Clonostachys chloroleuca TaxID=1926264 RepID=A0AA35QD50_9HYPO|nr:unnamed protein product [Clonostachys chloroleuca]